MAALGMSDKSLNIEITAIDRASQVIRTVADNVEKAGGKLRNVFVQTTESALRIESAQSKYNEAVAKYGASSLQARLAASALSQAYQRSTSIIGEVGAKLSDMGKAFQRTGRVLSTEVTAPLVIFGKTAVDAAVQIESAWIRVQKVFDGTTKQLKTELVPAAAELAIKWGVNQVEVAKVMEELAAFGFKAEEVIDGTTKAMELQRLGNLSTVDSMELVVALMQNYGVRGKDLTQIVADLNAVEDSGAARLTDMATSVGRVASVARSAGLDVKELGAMMSVLIGRGEKATISARALRTVFTRILSPTEDITELFGKYNIKIEETDKVQQKITKTVGKNEEEYKRLQSRLSSTIRSMADYEAGSKGINMTDEERTAKIAELSKTTDALNSQIAKVSGTQSTYNSLVDVGTGRLKPMDDILKQLAGTWKNLDETEKINFATIVAGRNHVDRFVKIMDDLSSGQSEYNRIVKETSDPVANMERMQKALNLELKSSAVQFGRLAEKFREFQRFVGQEIIPIILPKLDFLITKLTSSFRGLEPQMRTNIVSWGMLAAAIGPVTIVLGLFLQALGTIFTVISGVARAMSGLWVLALAHPLAAVAVAALALGVGLGYLAAKSDFLKSRTELVAQAEDRLRLAHDNLRMASDNLVSAQDRLSDSHLRVEGANLAVERAQRNYNQAITDYGPKSLEAREAEMMLKMAKDDLKGALKEEEQKTFDVMKAQDEYKIKAKDAEKATHDLNEAVKGGKTAFDRIADAIGGAISKLREWIGMDKGGGRGASGKFQHGGIVPGPIGQPMPAIVHGGERITPRGGVDESSQTTGGGGITININGSITMDSEERVRELARLIMRMLGREAELSRYGTGY